MGRWLRAMCHPDGEIAFFNDAAIGIAPSPEHLFDYARRLGLPDSRLSEELYHLDSTGYIRISKGEAVLLIDVAPIGPDYLPGHAHADTLSYELSLSGKRVLVNSGTSRYGSGREEIGSEALRHTIRWRLKGRVLRRSGRVFVWRDGLTLLTFQSNEKAMP